MNSLRIGVGEGTRLKEVTLSEVRPSSRIRVEVTMPRDTAPLPTVRTAEQVRDELRAAGKYPMPEAPVAPVAPRKPNIASSIVLGSVLIGGAAAAATAGTLCSPAFTVTDPQGSYVNGRLYQPGTYRAARDTPCMGSSAAVGAVVGTALLHSIRGRGYRRRLTAYPAEQARYQTNRVAYERAASEREARIVSEADAMVAQELNNRMAIAAANRAVREPPRVTVLNSGNSRPTGMVATTAEASAELLRDVPMVSPNPDAIAVIIGNQQYLGDTPPVAFALNDAATMRLYVTRVLGVREGNVYYVPNATKATLERYFGTRESPQGILANAVRKGRSDVYVFYSGHGAPDASAGRAYIMPVDADANYLAATGYALDLLYDNLAALGARHVTVMLDACFSGGTGDGGTLIRGASPIGIQITDPSARFARGNGTIFAAATGQQLASWYPEAGHGLFTYYLLRGLKGDADLNGDGNITVGEMGQWLAGDDAVSYHARRAYNREQVPQVFGGAERILRSRPSPATQDR